VAKNKILIVEDNVDTVELLRKRLRADGYDTAEAYDGRAGLAKVKEYEPDLIVLDIMMPGIDGFEVCRRLKADENTRHIPCLMLTAKSDIESKVKGLDVGGDDYLPKPFDYKELTARIRSLLSKEAARKEFFAAEKSEALDQMMDQVAHEIRNPLVAIGGFARRVSESLPEGDANRKYMDLIMQNVARLEEMIRQLVELKTTVVSYRESADVNEIIGEVIEIFEPELDENEVNVQLDLARDLPQIFVDREQIKAAIGHLVENSIEAMQDERRILSVATRLHDGYIAIQVADTGIGIPKEKLKSILDPFFTSKIHGGLGLPFALKIIQNHRGMISVESELGKGTTMTVRLPVKKPNGGWDRRAGR